MDVCVLRNLSRRAHFEYYSSIIFTTISQLILSHDGGYTYTGGTCQNCDLISADCTHLIMEYPRKNEKFLGSIASGKWILHTSYIEACKEANDFVEVVNFLCVHTIDRVTVLSWCCLRYLS